MLYYFSSILKIIKYAVDVDIFMTDLRKYFSFLNQGRQEPHTVTGLVSLKFLFLYILAFHLFFIAIQFYNMAGHCPGELHAV